MQLEPFDFSLVPEFLQELVITNNNHPFIRAMFKNPAGRGRSVSQAGAGNTGVPQRFFRTFMRAVIANYQFAVRALDFVLTYVVHLLLVCF